MNRALRAFLIWAMVIAMPVQGMAASLMLFCGTGHERVASAWVAGVAADARVHDGAAAGHDHEAHASHASTAAHDMGEGAGPAQQHTEHTCSACAACCSVLALPMSFSLPATSGMAHTMRSAAPTPRPSHQPDGLDRPPRSTRA